MISLKRKIGSGECMSLPADLVNKKKAKKTSSSHTNNPYNLERSHTYQPREIADPSTRVTNSLFLAIQEGKDEVVSKMIKDQSLKLYEMKHIEIFYLEGRKYRRRVHESLCNLNPLQMACVRSQWSIAHLLLEHHQMPDMINESASLKIEHSYYPRTALSIVAGKNDKEAISLIPFLLKKGAHLQREFGGRICDLVVTAAIAGGNREGLKQVFHYHHYYAQRIKLLIQQHFPKDICNNIIAGYLTGDPANTPDSQGRYPLQVAIAYRDVEMVNILLAQGADMRQRITFSTGMRVKKKEGDLLDYAVHSNNPAIIKKMREKLKEMNKTANEP